MSKHTVVIDRCEPETPNEQVSAQVEAMLARLPGIDERLARAARILIKVNTGVGRAPQYRGRPIDCVDGSVFAGLAAFVHERTEAHVLVGDGWRAGGLEERARERGYMAPIEQYGYELVDLAQAPYARFDVPYPAMFRWYELSSALQDVDLTISVSKMKSHHLCGITLSIKNLFGLAPTPVYAFPMVALHSPIRQPGILADLTALFPPEICLIDGIVGCNYAEWAVMGGDPVTTGVLIAGDNAVATDAVGAQYMCVDPATSVGTAPFWLTDNHIRFASERGLGSIDAADVEVIGQMPAIRKPFSVAIDMHPQTAAQGARWREEMCRQAQGYFADRGRYVRDYVGEIVMIGKGKVLMHAPAAEFQTSKMQASLETEGIGFHECFVKLVREAEEELTGPYGL